MPLLFPSMIMLAELHSVSFNNSLFFKKLELEITKIKQRTCDQKMQFSQIFYNCAI